MGPVDVALADEAPQLVRGLVWSACSTRLVLTWMTWPPPCLRMAGTAAWVAKKTLLLRYLDAHRGRTDLAAGPATRSEDLGDHRPCHESIAAAAVTSDEGLKDHLSSLQAKRPTGTPSAATGISLLAARARLPSLRE